ncbi:hypothetical protein HC766_01520 [Candidatus Gracilibacteria bacterium]|nr:hypothetical protein [Candidatus Gracilibacteria bacterium]
MDVIFQIIGILFWFVVILIPLVVVHEFGHLLMSRLVGVRVVEFGVGIPPRVWYRKWRGIIWSINAVWLGGFAKIYGDHDAIDTAHTDLEINPKEARSNYIINRIQELVEGKELEFFLEENNLEYNSSWKELEESGFLVGGLKDSVSEKKAKKYDKMVEQLEILVSWELDNKTNSSVVFYNKNIFQKNFDHSWRSYL